MLNSGTGLEAVSLRINYVGSGGKANRQTPRMFRAVPPTEAGTP